MPRLVLRSDVTARYSSIHTREKFLATAIRRSVLFFSGVENWHRWIALPGDGRPVGKAITGACNLMFLFLAISGIYIWFPRKIAWKSLRPVLWFRRGVRGKARDFNWHNVIGFWTSLVLIVLTLTASVMSYQWANNLLYTLTGNDVPQQQQGPPNAQQAQTEAPDNLPENLEAVWDKAEDQAEKLEIDKSPVTDH